MRPQTEKVGERPLALAGPIFRTGWIFCDEISGPNTSRRIEFPEKNDRIGQNAKIGNALLWLEIPDFRKSGNFLRF